MANKDEVFWIRLATTFPGHPKIAGLSDGAFRALIEIIIWSKTQDTDGWVRESVAKRYWGDALEELCHNDPEEPSLALYEDTREYCIHGYLEMQESSQDVKARKARNKANGARGGRPSNPKQNPVGSENKTHSVSKSKPSGFLNQNRVGSENETEKKPDREIDIDRYNQDLIDHQDLVIAHEDSMTDQKSNKDQLARSILEDLGIDFDASMTLARRATGIELSPDELYGIWIGYLKCSKSLVRDNNAYLGKCLRDSPEMAHQHLSKWYEQERIA